MSRGWIEATAYMALIAFIIAVFLWGIWMDSRQDA